MDELEVIASMFVEDIKLYKKLGGNLKELDATKVYELIDKVENKDNNN